MFFIVLKIPNSGNSNSLDMHINENQEFFGFVFNFLRIDQLLKTTKVVFHIHIKH